MVLFQFGAVQLKANGFLISLVAVRLSIVSVRTWGGLARFAGTDGEILSDEV